MKLPFSIAARFVFRLLIPGLILATILLPAIRHGVTTLGYEIDLVAYLSFSTILLGWVFTLLDLPIYMIYEGRCLWPRSVRNCALKRQQNKLAKITREMDRLEKSGDDAGYIEAAVKSSYFPIGKSGDREAQYPSALGNIMAEFEHYPTVKYGVDGVFYWYRIWLLLDLRDEIDEQKSVVDCAIYTSFWLILSSGVVFTYAIATILGYIIIPSTSSLVYASSSIILLLCAYLLYKISLRAHSQYGHLFKAMFDNFYSKFDLKPIRDVIAEATGEKAFRNLEGTEAYKAVWRYLSWHKVRLPADAHNRNIEDIKRQRERAKELVKG
jgi:hypothetical protein